MEDYLLNRVDYFQLREKIHLRCTRLFTFAPPPSRYGVPIVLEEAAKGSKHKLMRGSEGCPTKLTADKQSEPATNSHHKDGFEEVEQLQGLDLVEAPCGDVDRGRRFTAFTNG